MFRLEAPYWRRRRLCRGIARRLPGLGEAQPGEDEGSGQFRLQARRTREALEVNSWFLLHLESPRSPECQEKEERRLVAFKKKMYGKWREDIPDVEEATPDLFGIKKLERPKIGCAMARREFSTALPLPRKIGL